MTSAAAPPPPTVRRRAQIHVPVLLGLLALSAAVVVVVLAWASGWSLGRPTAGVDPVGGLLFELGVYVWNLSPFVAAGAAVVVVRRQGPRALLPVAVGVVTMVALTAGLLASFVVSDSSTAALLFLFLPAYLGAVAVAAAVLAGVVQWLLLRRAPRRSRPDDAERSVAQR